MICEKRVKMSNKIIEKIKNSLKEKLNMPKIKIQDLVDQIALENEDIKNEIKLVLEFLEKEAANSSNYLIAYTISNKDKINQLRLTDLLNTLGANAEATGTDSVIIRLGDY